MEHIRFFHGALDGVIRKNDYDLLTSGDLDLGSSSLNILSVGRLIISNHSIKFHKGLINSF